MLKNNRILHSKKFRKKNLQSSINIDDIKESIDCTLKKVEKMGERLRKLEK